MAVTSAATSCRACLRAASVMQMRCAAAAAAECTALQTISWQAVHWNAVKSPQHAVMLSDAAARPSRLNILTFNLPKCPELQALPHIPANQGLQVLTMLSRMHAAPIPVHVQSFVVPADSTFK